MSSVRLTFRTLREESFSKNCRSEHFGSSVFVDIFCFPNTSEPLIFQKHPFPKPSERVIFKKTSFRTLRKPCFCHFFAFRTLRKESFSKMTPSEVFGSLVFSPTLLPKCSEARFFRFSSLPKPSETVSSQSDSFRSVRKRSLSGDIPSETCGSFWLPL